MKEIIENAKTTIAQKKILWAYPIARELQQYHYSLAIQWAIKCIQIYSFDIQSNKLSKLEKYIQQAMDEQNVLTPSQCNEMSREIWYLPEREEIQTAISRLWWSIGAFKDGDEHGGSMEVTSAIELLLPDISDRDRKPQHLVVLQTTVSHGGSSFVECRTLTQLTTRYICMRQR